MTEIKAVQTQLRERARRARKRAETARTPALREYYLGRADGLQAACDNLQKLTYDLNQNPFSHEHTD